MRRLVGAVVSALVLAASAAAAPPPLPDPCSLLSGAQVTPALGGRPATHTASGNSFSRSCAWTGPPLGFMQVRQQFTVSVDRMTKARFEEHASKDIPKPDPLPGLGYPAFSEFGGDFVIWKNGIQLDLASPYLSVYPSAGKRLARSALKLLPG